MKSRSDALGVCALAGSLLQFFACSMDDRSGASGDSEAAGNADGIQGDDESGLEDELTNKFDLGTPTDWETKSGEGPGDEGVNEDGVCEIDFLFVIDNSGSMRDEQVNLAASVPDFIETVTEELPELESYQIGVVTTENYFPNTGDCRTIGGLITRTAGENASNDTCGPYANGRNFMTNADDLNETFPCAARPGTSGSGDERPMTAMINAVTGPLVETGACNAGFLRRDALLVVILITDEEDDDETVFDPPRMASGSGGSPGEWYDQLLAAKNGEEERVVMLGLLGTEKDNECDPLLEPEDDAINLQDGEGAVISRRLIEFVEMFGERGTVGDVCAPNYDPFFDDAISVIEFACDTIPPE